MSLVFEQVNIFYSLQLTSEIWFSYKNILWWWKQVPTSVWTYNCKIVTISIILINTFHFSWTGLRSLPRSDPCATCYGPTLWRTLAVRGMLSISVIILSEDAPISIAMQVHRFSPNLSIYLCNKNWSVLNPELFWS